ncbi:MAG: sirohydrochlorin cobaltochelatase [Clostridiales bacterium]|jgi:sirohydrochlorin cobaltochelatase|nr:sirohydrochlorin cobaltochelatase [Clostridiales bacterium]
MKTNLKTIASLTLCVMLFAALIAGCAKPDAAPEPTAAPTPEASAQTPTKPEEPEEPSEKKALLAVSFGTSYDDNRDLSIGAIETALQAAFPDHDVRRAFTSRIIIDILAERGLVIDDITEAMERLVADGVTDVIIQPTHVMRGYEYDDVMAQITPYAASFTSFKVGAPLLTADEDYAGVAAILADETAGYNEEDAAIVFMGHGTHHEANAAYAKLQDVLTDAGHTNYFIGTVEGTPEIHELLPLIEDTGTKKIVLLPLMIVAGDHANNDMAGDEEGSWKTILEAKGFEVECVLKGLGQYKGVQDLIVGHAQQAITP